MMPYWTQPAFPGMKQLNRVQSKVFETALFTPENILLCAPTGAGKTNIAVLTILHQIGLHRRDRVLDNLKYKIVYVAPMKALVRNLSRRLKSYNISVKELSGDQTLTRQQIEEVMKNSAMFEFQPIVRVPDDDSIISEVSHRDQPYNVVETLGLAPGNACYTERVAKLLLSLSRIEYHCNHRTYTPSLITLGNRSVLTERLTVELEANTSDIPDNIGHLMPFANLYHAVKMLKMK